MNSDREKLIKRKMYLESEKIRLAKKELHKLRLELEGLRGNSRKRKK